MCEQTAVRITEIKKNDEEEIKKTEKAANITAATVAAAESTDKKQPMETEAVKKNAAATGNKAKVYFNAIKYYALAKEGNATSDAEGNTVTIKSGDKVIVSLTIDGDNVKAEYPVGDKDKVEIIVSDSSSLGKALLFIERA